MAWEPPGAAWTHGSAASRAWLCRLDPWAPKPPWFFHGLGGRAGRRALLSSLVLARRWVGRSRLWGDAGYLGGRLKPVLSHLAPAARPLCLVFGASQHPRRRQSDLQPVGAGCLRAPWGELLLAAAGRRNGWRCGRGCQSRWFGVVASYCPGARLINCQCWPLPGGLAVPTIQNTCQDLVALRPGLSRGRSGVWVKKLDPHSDGLCSGGWCRSPPRRRLHLLPAALPTLGGISRPICGVRAQGARRRRQEAGRSCGLGWDGGFSAGSCHLEAISGAGEREPPSRGHTRRLASRGHSLPCPPGGPCRALPSPRLPSPRLATGAGMEQPMSEPSGAGGAAARLPFGRCISQSFGYGVEETHPAAFVLARAAAIVASVFPIPLTARHHHCKARGDVVGVSQWQGCSPLLPNPVPLSQLG